MKKRTKSKPGKHTIAKGCRCPPHGKSLYPINDHVAACPISKRYTTNGRIIADMLHNEKIRGNAKNYVVVSGSSLLDFGGTYDMRIDDAELKVPSVALVHKRNLRKIIGDEQAARFWKPGFGRVRSGS